MTNSLNLKGAIILFVVVFGGVFTALWIDKNIGRNQAIANLRTPPVTLVPAGYGIDRAPFDFSEAASLVIPSVVNIDTHYIDERISGNMQIEGGKGSGVVIDNNGYIVTNAHVIRNPRYKRVPRPADIIYVRTSDGHVYEAEFIGMDEVSDLAVLKVDSGELEAAQFGDSDQILVGEWVMAVGNQLGFDNSVSVGVVSSKNRWRESRDSLVLIDAIQTDASINRGNSGGALCNSMGQVIGINSIIATVNNLNSGVGFAIPSNHVRRVTSDLIELGEVRYAVLGIDFPRNTVRMTVPANRSRITQDTGFNNPPDYGLRISSSLDSFPASQVGMTENSVIMEIDGRRLYYRIDYVKTMMEKRPGQTADIKFWSKGVVKEVTVTLSEA